MNIEYDKAVVSLVGFLIQYYGSKNGGLELEAIILFFRFHYFIGIGLFGEYSLIRQLKTLTVKYKNAIEKRT